MLAACGQERPVEYTADSGGDVRQQEVSSETKTETETETETEQTNLTDSSVKSDDSGGLHIFSSDAKGDTAQAVSIMVNDVSFSSQSDTFGVLFSPDDGMAFWGVMFGGRAGNEIVFITAEFADKAFMSDDLSYQQFDFGNNIAIEIAIIDLDAGESCTASTVYEEGSGCYVSDGMISVAGYSADSSVNASVSGTLHYNGTSYYFQASGSANHDQELLAEMLYGNQGYGGTGYDNSCSLCSGTGSCYRCGGKGIEYTIRGQQACVSCNGSGRCSRCLGRGTF